MNVMMSKERSEVSVTSPEQMKLEERKKYLSIRIDNETNIFFKDTVRKVVDIAFECFGNWFKVDHGALVNSFEDTIAKKNLVIGVYQSANNDAIKMLAEKQKELDDASLQLHAMLIRIEKAEGKVANLEHKLKSIKADDKLKRR